MNNLIKFINTIVGNPPLLFLIGTIIATVCIAVFAGMKIACLILGIWVFVSMIAYDMKHYNF